MYVVSDDRVSRLGAIAGIVSAVVLIASFFTFGTPPDVDASGDEIAQFLADNRSGGLIAVLLLAVAIPLFAVFAAGLKQRLAASVGESLALVAVLAGVLFWLIDGLALSEFFGASWISGEAHAPTPDVAQTLWNIVSALVGLSTPLGALFLAVAAVAAFAGAMPKWHGWITAVIAIIVLLGVLSVVSSAMSIFTFFGSMLFCLWMILTGVLILRRQPTG